ncbi:MAG: 8-oxoguanine DNA glycosylase [Pedosphaera sp.]|nr:8-oxoguanine DNA glycosylase [Pedosphaera sp.]
MSIKLASEREWVLADFDLAATLTSGQAFRWRFVDGGWEAVVAGRWVRLEQRPFGIRAVTSAFCANWEWIEEYLRLGDDMPAILASFPDDPPMRSAQASCRGLRLLRQDPWESLASFIASSSKQIVQIQEIVRLLSERFGEPVKVPPDRPPLWKFPTVERLATATEIELRNCKLGFRAPYLLGTARRIVFGELNLASLRNLELRVARDALMECPGVGRKIAECVLLFGYGFPTAFPVDVWIRKALHRLYFPKVRRMSPQRLERFVESHFGTNSGYAQQYLFHYVRTQLGRQWSGERRVRKGPPKRQQSKVGHGDKN